MCTAPYGLDPQDLLQVGIHVSQKERGRPSPNGRGGTPLSAEKPLPVFSRQEKSRDIGNPRKRLQQELPHLLAFTNDPNVKSPESKEKFVVRSDLRPAYDHGTDGQEMLQLPSQEETAFHVPLVAAHPYQIRFDIEYVLKNGLVAAVRHQGTRQKHRIDPMLPRDRL